VLLTLGGLHKTKEQTTMNPLSASTPPRFVANRVGTGEPSKTDKGGKNDEKPYEVVTTPPPSGQQPPKPSFMSFA
jgi:hypothetical protein